jgi:thioredoxin 2
MQQAACPACLTGNRITGGDASMAKCGRCGQRLFAAEPLSVGDAELSAHLRLTKGAVLLDIWAPWCGPCLAMAPHFAEAARRLEPEVRFLKLNADESASAASLGVRGIPALILFLDGKEVARHAGLLTADQLTGWVRAQLPHYFRLENAS